MPKLLLLLTLSFSSLQAIAQSNRVVRFWEGVKYTDSTISQHRNFVADTLAPGTVAAGIGLLEHYIVYVPTTKSLPKNAFYKDLPFTEAAIPTYTNSNKYAQRGPEYGPVHFITHGFDSKSEVTSFSATPKLFTGDLVEISYKSPRESRIAYDLKNYEMDATDPNWQEGTTVIWLQLRKNTTSDNEYRKSATKLFQDFKNLDVPGSKNINGHFAKVAEGHILHFMNFKTKKMNDTYFAFIKSSLNDYIKSHKDISLITFDLIKAQSLKPFQSGWSKMKEVDKKTNQPYAGHALNVIFPNPRQIKE